MFLDGRSVKIQLVASDPEVTTGQNLEIEAGRIREILNSRGIETVFNYFVGLKQSQLTKKIKNFNPDIIHFSSSGSPHNRIRMYSTDGWVRNITGDTLSNLVFSSKYRPKCIFLNNSRVSRAESSISKFNIPVISVYRSGSGIDVSNEISTYFYSALGRIGSFVGAFNSMRYELNERFPHDFNFSFYSEEPQRKVFLKQGLEYLEEDKEWLWQIDVDESEMKGSEDLSEALKAGIAPSEPKGPRVYRTWFGTNREPVDNLNLDKGFGSKRSSKVRYGYCDVIIPKYHDIGSLGAPWWKRFPYFWRNNRLQVKNRETLKAGEYWKNISELFDSLSNEDRSLLIFLHGFNVSFDQAAIRAAQLGFDLSVRGTTAFFSWPSRGSISGYAADIASIEASEGHIAKFISEMAEKSGAVKTHLIAHSMGNRGLLRAFSSAISRASERMKGKLNQIFLAAPDVDADVFKRLAHVYTDFSQRTTMYISSKDRALQSSGIIHDYPRAGFLPPITIIGGIDTIEVSNIDLSFLGHSYIGDARSILTDMHTLMESNTPPKRRFGLQKLLNENGLMYWQIRS